jgi:hypothetical protein
MSGAMSVMDLCKTAFLLSGNAGEKDKCGNMTRIVEGWLNVVCSL